MTTNNWRWRLAQAAEIRWWKRYLGRQDWNSYLARKKGYWKKILDQTGAWPSPGLRVLDAGCGPAGVFTILDEYQTDAIDPLLDQYLAELPGFCPQDYPWVRFKTMTLEGLPQIQQYDYIFCLNAINHVQDIHLSLDNLANALKTSGKLLLTVDAHRFKMLKVLFQQLPGDILHPQQYDMQDYCRLLETRGMRITTTIVLKPGRIFDYIAIYAEKPPS